VVHILFRAKHILIGIKAALPVCLGYIPVGLAFGVLAAQAGLLVQEVFFMSLLVYAGSAQFISISMIAAGASVGTIITTTFLVNARHILMSASLAVHLKKYSNKLLALIGFGITDETYAVAISDLTRQEREPAYFLGLNLTSQAVWIASTVIGASVGNIIPDPSVWGLHFALPGMFIGLLVIQMKERLSIVIALVAFSLSLTIKIIVHGNWHVVVASVITATIGVIIEKWIAKSSQSSSA
jgi:4-azaleucine resistance transporter AzlC